MAANESKKEGVGVPYTSFKTLLNTLDRMKEQGGAPSRVDRSYLSNMPGGERGIFMTALKYLGLMTAEQEPTAEMHELVEADEPTRKVLIGQIVERVYETPLALPKRATQSQLEGVFREYGVTGSTLRRAIAFFLAATEFAGIERSPHFKLPARDRNKPKTKLANGSTITPPAPEPPHAPRVRHELDGLDPFIVGLVRRLPAPGEVFPSSMRKVWIDAAENIFALIYKDGSASTEARPEAPAAEGGGS